ncbi:hypothetical protein, partial [Nonomuraea dietziae]|uniref:hypothetical protein n=1 Tax=Nonomuraea dietziae TaxID=65515 RepID=UPI0031DAE58C
RSTSRQGTARCGGCPSGRRNGSPTASRRAAVSLAGMNGRLFSLDDAGRAPHPCPGKSVGGVRHGARPRAHRPRGAPRHGGTR